MKKHYLILITLFALLGFKKANAQSMFEPGYIILNDGTRIAGAIQLNIGEPWFNQRRIWFRDSAAMATNPNVRPKKYTFRDMKFFQAGDRQFEKVHYVDYENLQVKSMGSNDHMLEKLTNGRIQSYRFYQYPTDFDAYYGSDTWEEHEQKIKDGLLIGYKFLTKKDNELKFHDAFDYDLQIILGDDQEIWERYQKGGYGNEPLTPKKGLMAKMISNAKRKNAAFKPAEGDALIAAFNDYNNRNAKK